MTSLWKMTQISNLKAGSFVEEELRLLVTREKVHDRSTTGCTTGGTPPPNQKKS